VGGGAEKTIGLNTFIATLVFYMGE
jgi:hypothetical protein